ncbi:hypothetical protein MPTK1_4g00410 [Marchantia polymorpha subsp. ruderalis]|uniref:DUF7906 domain-containing protein n=2 Tax=Marchantia polymorpha TaxID=3197 RepID=A0A176VSH4_MARPO|nr:hypothetical protein AXG93_745s1040 [Marchantia polymorpha subsp. ruderalis]PTQ36149.1 hypothetical protein MARPO_0066s0100 [Marchantia polymorpha]BBN07035.1 hypothetical protein Mp_4g00410 [Marchantia polymorpha subsp. ruderalis]|eukprot:PTQ36149.1 hypothetical protein MARPO_0066s0100 [Marchantia polymorpha]
MKRIGGHSWIAMDLVMLAVFFLLGLVAGVESKTVEPFRRDVGHPQWHHGTFQDVSDMVKREAHHLLHSRARVPFHVPLEINVVLVGFNGDGGYRYSLNAGELSNFMKSTFPTHRPACLETGLPLDIEHDLYYNVIPVGQPELITLEWEIKKNMVLAGTARENEWGREIPLYEVEATILETSILDRLYTFLFGYEASSHSSSELNKPVPNAIFIFNFDKVRMDPRIDHNQSTLHMQLSDRIQELTPEELAQQEGGYTYRYRYNGGAASQVWLGSGRYAVIDLSAGPCVYGKIESDEGSVGYRSIPRLQHLLFPRRRDPVSKKDTEESFRGLLSSLIVSAIEHVISPDVRFEYVDPAMRLLVPVIVMRNHNQYNPLQPGTNFSINMTNIEEEVRKMVPPGQEVVVVGGVHNLHDHEKLAIAVVKALRSHSVHETRRDGRFHARARTYLDGALLREEMRHSTDVLAAGLLDVADPSLSSRYFRNENPQRWGADIDNTTEESVIQSRPARWGTQFLTKDKEAKKKGSPKKLKGGLAVEKSYGTRVIPVFVLSLNGVDSELLMEGEGLMWSSHDSVFVLQHNNDSVPLSYVSDTKRREAIANAPQRHIIAGLASVVGGLGAPYERASHIHGRPMHNWLWASGHHPFGPFSNTSSISQLLVDTALRNTIYSRVDMALRKIRDANEKIQAFTSEYLQTPLGEKIKGQPKKPTVELWLDMFYKKSTPLPQPVPQNAVDRLETYLDGLEDQLVNLAAQLYDHRLQDAFKNSTTVVRSSLFVQDYVDHVLWREKENMRCCRVEYNSPQGSSQAFVYGGILVAGFLVYALVIIFSSPER